MFVKKFMENNNYDAKMFQHQSVHHMSIQHGRFVMETVRHGSIQHRSTHP